MSTNVAEGVPPWAHRALIVTIVCYFALVVYATVTGNALASLAADALFGVVVIGIGAMLFERAPTRRSTLAAAGVSLVVGGVAQFAWLLSNVNLFAALSTVAVLFGVGLYAYEIWFSR